MEKTEMELERNKSTSGKDDWKKIEKNNPAIAPEVIYLEYILKMNIYPVSTSKHNLNHEEQIILLINRNGEGGLYLALKKPPVSVRGIG